ncbi:glycosyltransferase family 4 protein [Granulicella arctica]|uniref:glycosyltransferase family 4 protein n=1 Tax=Granulicella arctica TaxID=940613 RepID=UPI0021DF5FE4|nr:glycosyltransferase family 4 protein [Granulicella arctica]
MSGAERVLLDLLDGLDRSVFDPFATCPIEGGLRSQLHANGVPTVPVGILEARFTLSPRKLLHYFRSFAAVTFGLRASVKAVAPEVLHANSVRAGLVASIATLGLGIPIIWHVHDDLPKHPISSLIRGVAYLSKRSMFLAVSNATALAFCGNLPLGDRTEVLYNGINRERYPVKTTTASMFREELGLTGEDFLICAVGMINPRKGLTGLLDAFKDVYLAVPSAHLAVVGAPIFNRDDLYLAEIRDQAHRLGIEDRVHFTGPRSDVPNVLRSADLLVLNALVEPFGLVLIEAMSSGTPVLATRVGGIPEIITDNETGYLVAPSDPIALATRLLQVIDDPAGRWRVASTALSTVCPRFSQEQFRVGYMAYLRKKFPRASTLVTVSTPLNARSDAHS